MKLSIQSLQHLKNVISSDCKNLNRYDTRFFDTEITNYLQIFDKTLLAYVQYP